VQIWAVFDYSETLVVSLQMADEKVAERDRKP
jgi:hypothetical protein